MNNSSLRIIIITALVAMLSAITFPAWALTPVFDFQITSIDSATDAENDVFGYSVDIDGTGAIIGVRDDDENGTYAGSVYVYSYAYGDWNNNGKLLSPDGDAYLDQFGWSVAYDGNIAVIGAPGARAAQGRAYVYKRTSEGWGDYSWDLMAILEASDKFPGDQFGISVAIDGDTIVVGANLDDIGGLLGRGSAYYFSVGSLATGTTPHNQLAKLIASDGAISDQFGASVAVNGNTIVVGAPFDTNGKGSNAGGVYFYSVGSLVHGQSNTQLTKKTATDGSDYDHLGSSVAVYGGVSVVGAPGDDSKAYNSGAVYVFEGSGASWSDGVELLSPEGFGATGDHFGNAVAIYGNRAVFGANKDDATLEAVDAGAAYLFIRIAAGNWQYHAQMTDASDTSKGLDYFGSSVAIDGNTIVIGAPWDEDWAEGGGSAHFFNLVFLDYDSDGIEDAVDNCKYTWNPDQADNEGDGEGDACDTNDDWDLILDVSDNCPLITNQLQIDRDHDNIGDVCDYCEDVANTDQSDIDSDGLGDVCDIDKDGDGVTTTDNCPANYNPSQTDTDGDGIGDACDPSLDEDGDGVLDGADNCPLTANPDQTDNEGDGFGDACDADDDNDGVDDVLDNCPLTHNSDQSDLDGDLVGDACDADVDGDGVANAVDNCPLTNNPAQLDTDLDGIGNVCDGDDDNDGIDDIVDNCPLNVNPGQDNADGDLLGDVCDPDDDNDGILDATDNCPLIANTNQADADADGIGDVCDPDDDNDGVGDLVDNCPVVPNPDQSDADGDGLGDACDNDLDGDGVANAIDNCPANPNPYQEDMDSDGVGDVCDDDIDGDGYF
ncbi:MAG: thrombospondin type 3 repeat-containing protein, partial [Proteobacteria bacterium]|nr:thrombospondin type 3 repeat-containing protein [Pseudomonadota bacterium]